MVMKLSDLQAAKPANACLLRQPKDLLLAKTRIAEISYEDEQPQAISAAAQSNYVNVPQIKLRPIQKRFNIVPQRTV